MTCAATDCDRPAVRKGLCAGHLQRTYRGAGLASELRPYGRRPTQAFRDAVLDLLDLKASDRKAWRLAWKRVETAARRAFGRAKNNVNKRAEHGSGRCPSLDRNSSDSSRSTSST